MINKKFFHKSCKSDFIYNFNIITNKINNLFVEDLILNKISFISYLPNIVVSNQSANVTEVKSKTNATILPLFIKAEGCNIEKYEDKYTELFACTYLYQIEFILNFKPFNLSNQNLQYFIAREIGKLIYFFLAHKTPDKIKIEEEGVKFANRNGFYSESLERSSDFEPYIYKYELEQLKKYGPKWSALN